MQQFTGISRPTLYRLVPQLKKERIILFTREVGGSSFYRLNVNDSRVVSMLKMDFDPINEEMTAGKFDEGGRAKDAQRYPTSARHKSTTVSRKRRTGHSV